MVSKRYYHRLIWRLILLSLNSLLLSLSLFYYPNYSVIILLSALFVAQIVLLIRYLNRVNQKLENFFLFYLSGDVASSYRQTSDRDEFAPLYTYFTLITEKLEQARLKNELQNTYFKTIVDETAIGLISFKADGTVELFNTAAKKIFKMQVLRNMRRLDNYQENFSQTLIGMEANHRKLFSLTINNEPVQLLVKKVKFKILNEVMHLVSFQNIKYELEEKEFNAWYQLITVMIHEVNNSISSIMTASGTVGTMLKSYWMKFADALSVIPEESREKVFKNLDILHTRAKSLSQLIIQYKKVKAIPEPKRKSVNLLELLNWIVDLYHSGYPEKSLPISVSCRPSVYFQADRGLMEQVLLNLVKNSHDALQGIPDPRITLLGQSDEEGVLIRVVDNGPGIDPEEIDNIFVPYYTTKQLGTGIGLSLSRQIIRLHDGSITVHSEPGNTVFTIKL